MRNMATVLCPGLERKSTASWLIDADSMLLSRPLKGASGVWLQLSSTSRKRKTLQQHPPALISKDQQNHNQGLRLRCATSILPGLVFGVTAITRTARSHYLRRLRLASWRHVAYIALCTATVSSLVGTAVGFKVKDESGARSGTVEVAFTEELGMG